MSFKLFMNTTSIGVQVLTMLPTSQDYSVLRGSAVIAAVGLALLPFEPITGMALLTSGLGVATVKVKGALSNSENRACKAISQLDVTSAKLYNTSAKLDVTLAKLDDTSAQLYDTSAQLYDTLAKFDDTSAPFYDMSAKLDDTLAQLYVTSARLDDTSAHLDVTSAKLEDTSAHLDVTSAKLDDTLAHLDVTSAKLDDTSAHLDVTSAKLDDTSAHLDVTSAKLDDTSAHLDVTSAKLDDTLAQLCDTSVKLFDKSAKLYDVSAKLVVARGRASQLEVENSRLRYRLFSAGCACAILYVYNNYSRKAPPAIRIDNADEPAFQGPPSTIRIGNADVHVIQGPPCPYEPQKARNEGEKMCNICFENTVDTLILPCRHVQSCWECTMNLLEPICPFCRKEMTQLQHVFL